MFTCESSRTCSSKAARFGRRLLCAVLACGFASGRATVAQQPQVLNDPVDVSQDFQRMEQVYFVGSRVEDFDAATGRGSLQWDRYLRSTTLSFNKIDVTLGPEPGRSWRLEPLPGATAEQTAHLNTLMDGK